MKVAVLGACGKMGVSMMQGIAPENDMEIVGAVDIAGVGEPAPGFPGVVVEDNIEAMITSKNPDVIVDLTSPASVKSNADRVIAAGKNLVIGATGLKAEEIEELKSAAEAKGVKVFVAPNFALGAVLLMKFSAEAAKYFPDVEVIELHHDNKKDAPSGTAVKTMELMSVNRGEHVQGRADEIETLAGARGGNYEGMRVHSVRLPGYVAHQEVIFGGKGQILTLRHDSMSRESFVAGLLMALRATVTMEPGLIYGLDNLL